MNSIIPRRSDSTKWCSAEKAIYQAMQEVEKMEAHPVLTEAVLLLQKAKDKVADYIED